MTEKEFLAECLKFKTMAVSYLNTIKTDYYKLDTFYDAIMEIGFLKEGACKIMTDMTLNALNR